MTASRTMNSLAGLLHDADESASRYTDVLRASLDNPIDEIALMVEGERELTELRTMLPYLGWQEFNEARDRVRTGPIASRYEVRYVFFHNPDFDYRLEVMLLENGLSPLHVAIPRPTGGRPATVVHASFKTASEEEYAAARHVMEKDLGYAEAQRCDSTYGRFSYWSAPVRPAAARYLKPRVNLRDLP